MDNDLSAAVQIVLSYINAHCINGIAEFDGSINLPAHVIRTACIELKSRGIIRDCAFSDDSVEFVQL